MIDLQNGDMVIAHDGTSGLTVDGDVFWTDGKARDNSEISFAVRYTETGAVITGEETSVLFPELEIGAKGLAVVLAQTALKCKGYYSGKIDGDFGQQTYEAVRKFRQDNYLQGDTIVDDMCYKFLFKE